MDDIIKLKRGTAEALSFVNPILEEGEVAYDKTNRILKIGNGVTAWNALPGIKINLLDTDVILTEGNASTTFSLKEHTHTQYLDQTAGDDRYSPILHDHTEFITTLEGDLRWSLSDHTHLSYQTKTEADTLYSPISHGHTSLETEIDTRGMPPGGLAGRALFKNTDTDYDVSWKEVGGLTKFVALSQPGVLKAFNGTTRWYPPFPATIQSIESIVGIAPNGGKITYVIKKNGTVIFTGTILSGINKNSPEVVSITLTTDDYLTVDVTEIGTTTAGSDLIIRMKVFYGN